MSTTQTAKPEEIEEFQHYETKSKKKKNQTKTKKKKKRQYQQHQLQVPARITHPFHHGSINIPNERNN